MSVHVTVRVKQGNGNFNSLTVIPLHERIHVKLRQNLDNPSSFACFGLLVLSSTCHVAKQNSPVGFATEYPCVWVLVIVFFRNLDSSNWLKPPTLHLGLHKCPLSTILTSEG